MTWQLIASAPKDKVILLGYEPHWRLDCERRVFEGLWCDRQRTWTSVNRFVIHSNATHWQPLPEPPT